MTAIKTDPTHRVSSFYVPQGSSEYLAKLVELAKANSYLAGYEIE